jgi:hypothetical protein
MKIIDYRILEGFPSRVEEEVKRLMREGWQPFGGIGVIANSSLSLKVLQVMVKYEDNTKTKAESPFIGMFDELERAMK